MSFFKDFKEDFSQAVNELAAGEETAPKKRPSVAVNTLKRDFDMKTEMEKMEGLFEKVEESKQDLKRNARSMQSSGISNGENKKPEAANEFEDTSSNSIEKNITTEPEMEFKEEVPMSDEFNEVLMEDEEFESGVSLSKDVSDEVAVITNGTYLTGNMESNGSIEVRGTVNGNIQCNGKLTVTGMVKGNTTSAEFFADSAKVEGEISTEGTVKVGLGSVIIGNITATSAVIAGAIKGDIDVQGPVVVDTSAVVMGNIKSRSVQINNGAVIEGFCSQSYAEVDVSKLFDEK
jgi:cytoskeletal protein CcmA (bactofilin family)